METYYKEERGGALPEWNEGRFEKGRKVSESISGLPRTGDVGSQKLWCRSADGMSLGEVSTLGRIMKRLVLEPEVNVVRVTSSRNDHWPWLSCLSDSDLGKWEEFSSR